MKSSKFQTNIIGKIKNLIHKIRKGLRQHPIKYSAGIVAVTAALYLLITPIVVATYYRGKAMPSFYVASVEVGGMSVEQVQNKVASELASTKLILNLDDQEISGFATELGLTIDQDQLKLLVESRSLAQRFAPWFNETKVELPLLQNPEQAQEFIGQIKSKEFKKPKNASFSVKEDKLVISEHIAGIGVDSGAAADEAKLLLSQDLTEKSISLKSAELQPDILKSDIESKRDEITDKLSKEYAFKANDKKIVISKEQLAGLIDIDKQDGAIVVSASEDSAKQLVSEIATSAEVKPIKEITNKYLSGRSSEVAVKGVVGQKTTNTNSLAEELISKINANQAHEFTLEFKEVPFESETVEVDDVTITATYTYNVEVWGAVASDLAGFKSSAAETLASANGWAGAGVTFGEVASGGSFTLVLASPDRVAAMSSGCSAEYSCRVGRYVIINDQRWQSATPSWNAAGGGLRDYRHMVINHEVGHWLGFGHRSCTGAGQAAPVMLQQSISLEACKFNPWPTQAELDSL